MERKQAMRKSSLVVAVVGMALIPIMNVEPASAQTGSNSETYISHAGSDSGNCASAPCVTLTYTLTQTRPGGHIYVIDGILSPNENVTITGAVSIDGGIYSGSFGATAGTAFTINAGSSDTIKLANVEIHNFGSATNGIVFNSGGALALENTIVGKFSNVGLTFSPNTSGGNSELALWANSRITGNDNGNILVKPVGSTNVFMEMKDVIIDTSNNAFGVRIDTTAGTGVVDADIANALIVNPGTNGVLVLAPTTPASVLISDTHISQAAVYGVVADGADATILLNNSTITYSGTGVSSIAGGIVGSYGNNGINLNTNNNTGILTPQTQH